MLDYNDGGSQEIGNRFFSVLAYKLFNLYFVFDDTLIKRIIPYVCTSVDLCVDSVALIRACLS